MDRILLDDLKERAKDLAVKNNWGEEAVEVNRKIIELDSTCSGAYTRLAKCYVKLGDEDTAVKLWEQLLEFDPENTIAINRLIEHGIYGEIVRKKKQRELEESK